MFNMDKKDLEKFKKVLLKEKEKIETALSEIAMKDPDMKNDYDAIFPDFGSSADENAQEVTEFDRRKSLEYNLRGKPGVLLLRYELTTPSRGIPHT